MIFDLWDTLVDFDPAASREGSTLLAQRAGADPELFVEAWTAARPERDVGPLLDNVRAVCAQLGLDGVDHEALCDLRREWARAALVPRPGAVETLQELGLRGLRRGLVSVCSSDVEDVWDETALAPHLDATVFSCAVGLRKPDPRIYLLACDRLGVEPHECLFVGDGANDELAGAERVGMRAALILRPEQDEPYWEEAHGWQPCVTSIPDVLALLDSEAAE